MGDIVVITIASLALGVLNYILYTRYQEDLQSCRNACNTSVQNIRSELGQVIGLVHQNKFPNDQLISLSHKILDFEVTLYQEKKENKSNSSNIKKLMSDFKMLKTKYPLIELDLPKKTVRKKVNRLPTVTEKVSPDQGNVINLPGMSFVNGVLQPTKKKPGPKKKEKKEILHEIRDAT